MRLTRDWIRVKVDAESERTKSGLIFKPMDAHETILQTGIVVDTGPGCWSDDGSKRVPLNVKKGDGVLFIKFVVTATQNAKAINQYLNDQEGLIREGDILLSFEHTSAPEFC